MGWKVAFATVTVAVAVAVPAAQAGAIQSVETWAHVSGDLFYAGDGLCGTTTVAGPLVDGSGIARITELPDGSTIVRGHSDDTWRLYKASGPPWDVTFGAYYGTMAVHVPFEELVPPSGVVVLGNDANGTLTLADGSRKTVHIQFRMVIQPGQPPKFFHVHFVCGN